jgi:hypothetical protein
MDKIDKLLLEFLIEKITNETNKINKMVDNGKRNLGLSQYGIGKHSVLNELNDIIKKYK